ncbi:MAG: acyl-CoA dehydrogenase [Alphaproteobacteria bacterium]|jgi:acyl-CoA dehydrogenase|nr:acyl-CoA dehydrogenase [Alphaproteobacteria bacterium]
MLLAVASPEQREKYLRPYANGEVVSAMAISEPGAGADPRRMSTRANWDGRNWVLNGRKIWISKAAEAEFTIAMAVASRDGANGGITAFLVDKGTPGFNILRRIPMIGGQFTYEIAFEDCKLPPEAVLGGEGQGFAPMQKRLSVRRLQMGSWCVGIAQRALDILIEHASQRTTFGSLLAQRQTIQWWAADAATKIHATRLMVYDAARKVDQGREARAELSMIKVYASEMATEVIDKAMQTLGAMGMTKEIPLYLMAEKIRWIRVGEPSGLTWLLACICTTQEARGCHLP